MKQLLAELLRSPIQLLLKPVESNRHLNQAPCQTVKGRELGPVTSHQGFMDCPTFCQSALSDGVHKERKHMFLCMRQAQRNSQGQQASRDKLMSQANLHNCLQQARRGYLTANGPQQRP